MTSILTSAAAVVAVAYLVACVHFCLLLALELALPRGRLPSTQARKRALMFVIVATPFIVLIPMLAGAIERALGLQPFFSFPIASGWLLPAAFLMLLVADFFQYWIHRAQHAIPALWRFHAIHHSVEEMGAMAGYHHVTEPLMRVIFIGLPMTLLFPPIGVAVLGVVVAFHGNYLHSATRPHFGRLAWLVIDNRVHRIHHSREVRHYDRNFGTFTLIWDRLFGTAYFPRSHEWPDTGLTDQGEPQTIRDYLFRPFRLTKLPVDIQGAGIDTRSTVSGPSKSPL